jgi:hypothetical protein
MYHENGHSKNKTAVKFNIQTKQLRDWISKKPQLLKVQPGVKRLNIGVKPKYPALESALVTWVKEKRKNQNAVTRSMIQVNLRNNVNGKLCILVSGLLLLVIIRRFYEPK